ncbi:MAG TPA: hypothetical protein VD927_11300 [Chryseosolibacter sp.]|nr:hypothetical protein [Chryseosolibacter sp.]
MSEYIGILFTAITWLVSLAVTWSKLQTKQDLYKKENDFKIQLLTDRLEKVENKNEGLQILMNEVNIKLTTISTDCTYIKENINKIERRLEE